MTNNLYEAEGMVEVIETELVSTAEKVSRLMDAQVELKAGVWELQKKRTAKANNNSIGCVNWSLDLSVAFSSLIENGKAVNEAKIFILPEELPIFTRALIRHQIPFPTTYSQEVSMDRGMYCIRLKSLEQPEDFALRLADSLSSLH